MKKLNIKSSTTIVLLGVALSLFSLVILFSHGTPFEFLTVAICASFGFIGFWILTPFLFVLGLYISFRKKLIQFKLGLSLWGIFIVVLSLLVITSNWGNTETITFNNCVALLKEHTQFPLILHHLAQDQIAMLLLGQYPYLSQKSSFPFNSLFLGSRIASGT